MPPQEWLQEGPARISSSKERSSSMVLSALHHRLKRNKN